MEIARAHAVAGKTGFPSDLPVIGIPSRTSLGVAGEPTTLGTTARERDEAGLPGRVGEDEAGPAGEVQAGPPHAAATREADRQEVRGAIAMVSQGFATRIVVCGLHDPEAALASLMTEAVAAGASLHLDRRECGTAVEVRQL